MSCKEAVVYKGAGRGKQGRGPGRAGAGRGLTAQDYLSYVAFRTMMLSTRLCFVVCACVLQVSGPADASNFDVAQSGAQHARRNSRYISTGIFKDF